MTEQRRYDGPNRGPWKPWKRALFTVFMFLFGWSLNRQRNGLSWSACILTMFAIVFARRLWPLPWEHGLKIIPEIGGFPAVLIIIAIIWGRWIDSAATAVAEKNPEHIVDVVLAKLIDRLGVGD